MMIGELHHRVRQVPAVGGREKPGIGARDERFKMANINQGVVERTLLADFRNGDVAAEMFGSLAQLPGGVAVTDTPVSLGERR